ncbi:hypothetical protein BKA64DRAFT_724594 [Cadophora sp. MPI-SDFR-AT-0126]|nr:hypothetical protein BKA64DRAFT_724594 [Leotiomycetes sp. MPI-SDFR-AT-0126]
MMCPLNPSLLDCPPALDWSARCVRESYGLQNDIPRMFTIPRIHNRMFQNNQFPLSASISELLALQSGFNWLQLKECLFGEPSWSKKLSISAEGRGLRENITAAVQRLSATFSSKGHQGDPKCARKTRRYAVRQTPMAPNIIEIEARIFDVLCYYPLDEILSSIWSEQSPWAGWKGGGDRSGSREISHCMMSEFPGQAHREQFLDSRDKRLVHISGPVCYLMAAIGC